ncbi:hypothetical protein L1887_18989 [Cichorium endivia]|nr:hypothetical protein L1887_18989 [Cichorium endivia]
MWITTNNIRRLLSHPPQGQTWMWLCGGVLLSFIAHLVDNEAPVLEYPLIEVKRHHENDNQPTKLWGLLCQYGKIDEDIIKDVFMLFDVVSGSSKEEPLWGTDGSCSRPSSQFNGRILW